MIAALSVCQNNLKSRETSNEFEQSVIGVIQLRKLTMEFILNLQTSVGRTVT